MLSVDFNYLKLIKIKTFFKIIYIILIISNKVVNDIFLLGFANPGTSTHANGI